MAESTPFNVSVFITPSLDEIAERYQFTPLQVQQIGTVAINRSLGTVSTSVVGRLAGAINLRQAEIRESIGIRKASFGNLSGSVSVGRRPVPLIDFIGTTQTPSGVSVTVRRDSPPEVLGSTFIATMKSGHSGVFERRFEAGKSVFAGPRFGRLPIFERYGLTLTGYLANAPQVADEEQAKAGRTLARNVASQVARRVAEQSTDET